MITYNSPEFKQLETEIVKLGKQLDEKWLEVIKTYPPENGFYWAINVDKNGQGKISQFPV